MTYEKKIDFAIKLLRSIPQDGPIELAYSTGKDSDIILELAKMAGIPFVPIYKNTTCDQPGSMSHAREMGVEIRQPKMNMLQIIEYAGWPSRFRRVCCNYLKEYKIYDRCILGIRRSESTARAKRYKEPEECRVFSKTEKQRLYFPILEWNDDDVCRFIEERGLKLHPHYYDKDGKFCVERRVGCIGCPMATDNGIGEYKKYPYIFKARFRAFKRWYDNHPDSKTAREFESPYHRIFALLFCETIEEYETRVHPPLFPELAIDPKQFLEDYFHIDLTL